MILRALGAANGSGLSEKQIKLQLMAEDLVRRMCGSKQAMAPCHSFTLLLLVVLTGHGMFQHNIWLLEVYAQLLPINTKHATYILELGVQSPLGSLALLLLVLPPHSCHCSSGHCNYNCCCCCC
jgi:hypothetical protein